MMDNTKTIIGITGMAGSGKDEVIKLIMKENNTETIVLRHIVEKELQNQNLPINNKTLREYATTLREEHGYDIIARKSLSSIKKALDNVDLVIVNTIKSKDEIDLIAKELSVPCILLSIHASPLTRFERLSKRGLSWDMKDLESFEWRDKMELKWGLGEAMALSDYVIVNDNSLEDLKKSVKIFCSKLPNITRRLIMYDQFKIN